MILTDLVQDHYNPLADVFNPARLKPDASAAKKLVTQNMQVIRQYAEGHLAARENLTEIAPGEGCIARVDKQRSAVYRDENGQLFILNPVCTHMGCVVTWNNAEKTWDCPCHGSRYNFNGEVIQSPAVKGLAPLKSTARSVPQVESRVASTSDLAPGKMIGIESMGKKILLANVDGKYYAIGNTCTHKGCSLSDGTLNNEKVQCHCHGSIFDVRTGQVVKGPAKDPEPTYPLKIEGDQITLIV
jgi:Rieske Fe-S protein